MAKVYYYALTPQGEFLTFPPRLQTDDIEDEYDYNRVGDRLVHVWAIVSNLDSLTEVSAETPLTDCLFFAHVTGTYSAWDELERCAQKWVKVEKTAAKVVWCVRVINGIPGNVTAHNLEINGLDRLVELLEEHERNAQ